MELNKAFMHLGFSEKEALIYASLLQIGQGTAYEIAKRSNLKRPTVYALLDNLRMKGAVLKVPHAKKQVFIAKSPKDLVGEAVTKTNLLVSILPQLNALESKDGKPNFLYYEGAEELRELLYRNMDRMKGKEIVGFYAHGEGLSKKTFQVVDEYNDYLKENGISTRGIVPRSDSVSKYRKLDKEYGRDMKMIEPEKYSSRISFEIGDGFVRLISFPDQQGILIENKNVAGSLKQVFEMVWSFL